MEGKRKYYQPKKFYPKRGNSKNPGRIKVNRSSNNYGENCMIQLDSDTACGPYQTWKTYFPLEPYDESSEMVRKVKSAEKYILKLIDVQKVDLEKCNSFVINVKHILCDDEVIAEWPSFLIDLKTEPKDVINYFSLSMSHIIHRECQMMFSQQSPGFDVDKIEEFNQINNLPGVSAQFSGFEVMPFKNLKMNTYGKFVSVKGTVIRVGNINTFCTQLSFQCNKCKNLQVILQPNGNFTPPNRCVVKSCFSHNFEPIRLSKWTKMIPWQNIRIQELVTDEICDKGRIPRTIECELRSDLVDRCIPGDIVTVSGIVKVIDPKEKLLGAAKNKSTYVLYILVNHIECLKEKKADLHEVMPGGLNLDISDLYAVRYIHDQTDLFNLVVASLCPNIYGHEIIKAGLILSLFGGTQRYVDDDNRVPVRGDSHVLIVGDPGLGKSQMLLACANVSPRGVYVCGNTSTSSGLTVTITKEVDGENGLDAGALVLADQGCCCIDEFDKMTNQHHALLEAMEQQTISIAKSGISCTLPARTSIIAAANPVGGHYNKAKTVTENIKLSSALLSRFDLVFIVIDKADSELDNKLSEYVMAMHNGNTSHKSINFSSHKSVTIGQCSLLDGKSILVEQFKYKGDSNLISIEQLRKYIAYARKYVQPKLSTEAAKILQEFYIDLRRQNQSPNSTPITNRQLESMIRLTEARARVELREICTADDARVVVDILKHSMVDTYSDEFGNIHFERSIHGSGVSKQAKMKKYLKCLNSFAARNNSICFTKPQLEEIACDIGMDVSGFDDFIESLNYHGYMIKKGPKLYQLQTL